MVNMQKGQRISLEKEAGKKLNKVFMGLGWDVATEGKDIDLDASCAMYSADKNLLDVVYFGQLKSRDGSIVHSGDNLTGEGEGDDEVINVTLDSVPKNVAYLVFTVSSYKGQTFNEIANAFCRLVDGKDKEIARYEISGGGPQTAMIMAVLYRHGDEWKMRAMGEALNGKTVNDLVEPAKALL